MMLLTSEFTEMCSDVSVVLPLANMLFPLLQQSPFFAPATSIVKVMSMTTGDFSFDTIFRKSPSGDSENTEEIMFPAIAYLLWIIFLIVMPILFINLLVRSLTCNGDIG